MAKSCLPDEPGTVDPKAEAAKQVDPKVQAAANKLLEADDLIPQMLKMTEQLGHVGEHENRAIVFLAAVAGLTARTYEDALHIVVKGSSAGGKNALVRRVLQLFPTESHITITNATEAGLIYHAADVRVLVIQEVDGSKKIEYTMRQAMSEGKLARMTAHGIHEEDFLGSLITTTTKLLVHPENETRMFSLRVDDSPDVTRQVLLRDAASAAGEGPKDETIARRLLIWREALSKLEGFDVVIPFAPALSEAFPVEHVRNRRDWRRTVNLIRATAILHQRARETDGRGRLIAEVEDYEVVRPMLELALSQSIPVETDPWASAILESQERLSRDLFSDLNEGWVDRVQIQEDLAGTVSEKTVREWAKRFVQERRWEVRNGRRGRLQYRSLDGALSRVSLPVLED